MKVVDFINELNRIGYDDDTELTFSCMDGNTGEWYELNQDTDNEKSSAFSYGKDLTGEEYCNDVIDFCLDVDSCDEYLQDKISFATSVLQEELNEVFNKYFIR